jgi:hypothetical protein
MTNFKNKCPHCGTSIAAWEAATRRTFEAVRFECGGEAIDFDGETKHCVTGRWSKAKAA